jgi:hypothetical protein
MVAKTRNPSLKQFLNVSLKNTPRSAKVNALGAATQRSSIQNKTIKKALNCQSSYATIQLSARDPLSEEKPYSNCNPQSPRDSSAKVNKPIASQIHKNPFANVSPSKVMHKRENSIYNKQQISFSKKENSRKHSWGPSLRDSSKNYSLNYLRNKGKQNLNKTFTIDPEVAIKKYKDDLTTYELSEIRSYQEIYYASKIEYKLPKLDENLINYGWDDKKSFYIAKEHDHLIYRYEIISILGKGAFGTVYRCLDHKNKEEVAIKILRNKEKFHKQGKIEINILKTLNSKSKYESQFIVSMKNNFVFRNHICIVFEILSIDLYELIKSSKFAVLILSGLYFATCKSICKAAYHRAQLYEKIQYNTLRSEARKYITSYFEKERH